MLLVARVQAAAPPSSSHSPYDHTSNSGSRSPPRTDTRSTHTSRGTSGLPPSRGAACGTSPRRNSTRSRSGRKFHWFWARGPSSAAWAGVYRHSLFLCMTCRTCERDKFSHDVHGTALQRGMCSASMNVSGGTSMAYAVGWSGSLATSSTSPWAAASVCSNMPRPFGGKAPETLWTLEILLLAQDARFAKISGFLPLHRLFEVPSDAPHSRALRRAQSVVRLYWAFKPRAQALRPPRATARTRLPRARRGSQGLTRPPPALQPLAPPADPPAVVRLEPRVGSHATALY